MEQWAEEEMERALAEMTGSLEQLSLLEEKEEESGSSVHGSETCLREWLLVARVLFIEGARAFKHKKCILERNLVQLQQMLAKRSRTAVLQSWWEGEVCRSGEGMWDSAGSGTVRWHV